MVSPMYCGGGGDVEVVNSVVIRQCSGALHHRCITEIYRRYTPPHDSLLGIFWPSQGYLRAWLRSYVVVRSEELYPTVL